MEIHILLNRHLSDLEKNVSRETFRLGCTPIVNFFRRRAEPIRLTQTETEYRVVPDARRPRSHEVYSIDRVVGDRREASKLNFLRSTQCVTRPILPGTPSVLVCAAAAGGICWRKGGLWDRSLSHSGRPRFLTRFLARGNAGCRDDLPESGHAALASVRRRPATSAIFRGCGACTIQCLTRPTATLRPPLRHGTAWRLISHLSLNHLSLLDTEGGADALARNPTALRFPRFG
jgi:type VI secretion system protein ImpG